MGKIFCLMGKSSSGKDTIFKAIKEDKNLKLKAIVSYTTRPKRTNETEGIEYHFINKEELIEYRKQGKVIEERKYDTINGAWYYSTIDDGQINLEYDNYIVIVTLEAYKDIKQYFGEDNVIPLYIELDDGVRLQRALNREMAQESPNYDELCRRFLADNKDFSYENLKICSIKKNYINDNLNECIQKIKNEILKFNL